jgi:hypothetical protein
MTGLDTSIISNLDYKLALNRIQYDVKSDFIIAPHYSAVYSQVGDELWDEVEKELKSGTYITNLPITIEIPKSNGLTRPGSILLPKDRFVYQLIVDYISPIAEQKLDRSKVFSQILSTPSDPNMFSSSSNNWLEMQRKIIEYCNNTQFNFAIKADIACFFERLYQHNLINLLHSCGCDTLAVNFLEKLLSAWMEKNSHGILQGMFPSDFLGNFYLYGLDSDLTVRDNQFVRYVDDIYIFYKSNNEARIGMLDLCRTLRHEGLHLNDKKTRILPVEELLKEETIIDRLFQEARNEIESEDITIDWYSFQIMWEELDEFKEGIEIKAIKRLFNEINNVDEIIAEKIEKFCLPFLGFIGSSDGVERSIEGMTERPHLSKLYSTYLGSLSRKEKKVIIELENFINTNESPYDWQLVWILASLIPVENLQENTIKTFFQLLRDLSRSVALRALCAIAVGKHGSPGQRRNLKHHYGDEPSEYVRSAILFSTRYFPAPERHTCQGAWSTHNPTNNLVSRAVSKLA